LIISQRGHGILVPDLLGYGGTSKPLDVQRYKEKGKAEDIKYILDVLKLETVIGVAHDWLVSEVSADDLAVSHSCAHVAYRVLKSRGSFLLSRLANCYIRHGSPNMFSLTLAMAHQIKYSALRRLNISMQK
jgi:hypothetical protein